MKGKHGITLISLVISIVLILILAGIAVLFFNPNGITARAKDAKNEYEKSAKVEDEQMKNLSSLMESVTSTSNFVSPVLLDGMTPIKWNGTSWEDTSFSDPDWYNYDEKVWANVRLDDGSMFVWIPRFAYKITKGWHTSQAGDIDIVFVNAKNIDESGNAYSSTYEQSISGIEPGDSMLNYVVHPAFTYTSFPSSGQNKELTGFWVGKFESSQSDAISGTYTDYNYTGGQSNVIKVQPGVNSWRNLTVIQSYELCKNMNEQENPYGLTNSSDPHMLKNTEWGAIAYLSRSKYGQKDSEIMLNNSINMITGASAISNSANQGVETILDYSDTLAQKASTTGNIYGVYDMAGGSWEHTSAFSKDYSSSYTTYFLNDENVPSYHKDIYQGASDRQSNYLANSGKYGDAIYETSAVASSYYTSWFSDSSLYLYSSAGFFKRGGGMWNGSKAGIYYFGDATGGVNKYHSFRVSICAI